MKAFQYVCYKRLILKGFCFFYLYPLYPYTH